MMACADALSWQQQLPTGCLRAWQVAEVATLLS